MTQQHQEDTQVQRADPSETYDDDRTAVASRHRADVRTSAATEVDPSYRGFKGGAAFFGWLVAIGLIALLTGIVGAIAAAVDYAGRIDWNNTNADTLGIASGVIQGGRCMRDDAAGAQAESTADPVNIASVGG